MRAFAVAGLACLLAGASVSADNWPHWRGPRATGISPESGLPVKWSQSENVAWKTQVRGLGVSSPVVWGDRVFVTSQYGSGTLSPGSHPTLIQGQDARAAGERPLGGSRQTVRSAVSFLVSAFHRADGRRLWEYELKAEGDLPAVHEKHNLASSSPVTDGERVYAWFGSGQVVALDSNGKLVWKRHLGAEYSPFEINWGHASSPVLYRDSIILLCYHEPASYLLALDKHTGKVRWKADRASNAHSYSTPLVVASPQGPELIVNSSEGVEGFNPETGERRWHFHEANRFPIPVAVFHENVVYLSRGYRSGPYMAIRMGGRGDVSGSHVVWRVPTGAPYISSLVHHDGLLYMAGELGIVTCIDAATGQRVWQERLGGIFTASPVAGDGKIYLLSETGETVVLRAGRKPEVLSRNALDGRFVASPAISGGRLFFRSDDGVISVGK